MHSDIHVVVRFHEHSVFAGEELRCTITFKNVATLSEPVTPALQTRRRSRRESISQLAAQATRTNAAARLNLNQNGRARNNNHDQSIDPPSSRHRATASYSPASPEERQTPLPRPTHQHQRSVSIMSVTSPIAATAGEQQEGGGGSSWARQQRLSHQRSSTIATQHPTPRNGSPFLSQGGGGRRSPLSQGPSQNQSRESTPDFKFPPERHDPPSSMSTADEASNNNSLTQPTLATRIISGTNQVASERSSGDFYSLSNHSQETLMSEQPSLVSDHRPLFDYSMPLPRRRAVVKAQQKPQAVNLLMGYAQLSASFTLDASLIDQAHFEDVKSKGFLGGQAGGGVVGVKKPRPSSGFLGNFSLNHIGDSLNSLMGGDDMSSVKEMNTVKNARAIPLLSTPQSLLFVDMRLEPGEEQSYSYVYPLPRGLPSSHRGKAIKISYSLTVGVQGLPGRGARDRDVYAVRQVSVPIRVFSGVDYDGEIFGHDLMQPHVILRDLARTRCLSSLDGQDEGGEKSTSSQNEKKSTTDFLQFVDALLDRNRRRQSSSGTMESFLSSSHHHQDSSGDHRSAIQAINRAILYSNQLVGSDSSHNRFEITRNGLKVAVVVIDRPLHRLGETVTAVVDFDQGQVPCASLRSTLETSEKVSPSLAVRSATTISRITRKVYWARSDNILFSTRATFAPSIPASATPTFVTSGVNHEWSLRFEFGTIKPTVANDDHDHDDDDDDDDGHGHGHGQVVKSITDLLEEVVRDERGSINVAVENFECETFEVVIPLTVYGDLVPDGKEGEEIVGIPV